MSQIPLNTFLGHLGVMLCMGREGGHTMDGSGLDTLQMQTLKINYFHLTLTSKSPKIINLSLLLHAS